MRLSRRAVALGAAALGLARPAAGQGPGQGQGQGQGQAAPWPERPVRLVVPFVAGGSVDILNRAFAQALGRQLGQTVVVENRPGGTTSIGTAYVARSAPDGYTLLAGSDSVQVNRYLMAALPYDPDRDLTPVLQLADVPYLLLVNAGLPLRSLGDILEYGRAHPGKLTYASFGIGGGGHLAGELLCMMGGMEALHVPYPGNPPALLDVAAGRVSMMFCTIPVAQPELRSGRVRPIALSSTQRVPALPEVPTLSEAGLPGYECTGSMVLYVPSGVPAPIQARLLEASREAARDPDLVRLLQGQGFVLTPPRDPAAARAHIQAQAARLSEVIRKAGIRL
jgi:tripartite-type tricarboxylate transporter receptor subunit TctC